MQDKPIMDTTLSSLLLSYVDPQDCQLGKIQRRNNSVTSSRGQTNDVLVLNFPFSLQSLSHQLSHIRHYGKYNLLKIIQNKNSLVLSIFAKHEAIQSHNILKSSEGGTKKTHSSHSL